jgi:ABC-type methionine transport system ATPase subunit
MGLYIAKKYPYQMSGGQKQRVAAARAIITNPCLVLADEPTGALDSKSSKMLLEKLTYLNNNLGATILMVTHDAYAASYATRIIFIKDGKIYNEITIKDILCFDEEMFKSTIKQIKNSAENHIISDSLEKMRLIINDNKPGCNVLRYLTTKTNNLIIRNQLSDIQHPYLSNLFLSKKCGMFDALPYAMLIHNKCSL